MTSIDNPARLARPPEPDKDIRIVLFDVGGVLVELSGVKIMCDWLGKTITEEELWRRWLQSESVRDFETGRIEADSFARAVTREFGLDIAPERFLKSFAGWPLGLYPGAVEMLERIPPRYGRALLSNSNALHWPRIMGEMGIESLFDQRFVSHLTGKIKPDAAAFAEVADSLGCAPAEILFLDDNALNTEAAVRVGMQAVRVQGPLEAERRLIELGIIPTTAQA